MFSNGKVLLFIILAFLFACTSDEESSDAPRSKIDILMDKVYSAHGELGQYSFTFRENDYSFDFNDQGFTYSKTISNDSTLIQDTLNNEGFCRYVDGSLVDLSEEEMNKYSESLNSVIYFTCIPLNLSDPAVNKTLKSDVSINGNIYNVVEVTFDAEGGGKDHEDVFCYWFNQETNIMDYMAYSYNVNGGGVRFRSAYNSRMIDGMRFQDYINYEAPVGSDLELLPELFQQGELNELSRIEVENVRMFLDIDSQYSFLFRSLIYY